MYINWYTEFSTYFNRGASSNLRLNGHYIERYLGLAVDEFIRKYNEDPFGRPGNFQKYWNLVQFIAIQQGMVQQDFNELTRLAHSFNEGNNWN